MLKISNVKKKSWTSPEGKSYESFKVSAIEEDGEVYAFPMTSRDFSDLITVYGINDYNKLIGRYVISAKQGQYKGKYVFLSIK